MINRCYNVKDKCYKTYGAKGVYVCNDWLYFSNYLYWFMDNYIEGYHVDKDILKEGYYSPDTCLFISPKENIAEMHNRVQMNFKNSSNYKPFEYYETTPIQSSNFKQKCIREGVDYYDFEPTLIKRDYYTYKYSPENKQNRINLSNPMTRYSIIPIKKCAFKLVCNRHRLDYYDFEPEHVKGEYYLYKYSPLERQSRINLDNPMLRHSVIPIKVNSFKIFCKKHNLNYYDFEPKKVENGRFIYIYSPENSSYRESLDDPYLRFSIIPSYRSQFKKFCKNNSLNFYDFIETVVGKKGSHELYNYFYKKEEN